MLTNRDTGLIRLAWKRKLIDTATMQALMDQLDGESSGMAESLLVEAGLTQQQIAGLVSNQRAASIPAHFDGYSVSGVIGKGGMSVVLKASEDDTNRVIALKLLSPHAEGMHNAQARFEREMEASSRIVHPNLVSCYGSGRTNYRPYIAMEYMAGGDLGKRLKRDGRLPPELVLRAIHDAANGLIAVRAANLIHRDIKPDNLFLADDGSVKIGDLGLTRLFDDHEALTLTGITVGTPHYMSPEQALGRYDMDFRSDFFSLGSTAYHLLSGSLPFTGSSNDEVLRGVVKQPAVALSVLAPGTPPALAAIIDCLLAKEPADRYQCAEALVDDCRLVMEAGLDVAPFRLKRQTAPDRHGTGTQIVARKTSDHAARATTTPTPTRNYVQPKRNPLIRFWRWVTRAA